MRTRTDHSHLRSRKSLSVFVTRCGPRETPADEHAHHTNESPRNRTFSVAKTIFLFGRRDVGTEKLLLETQHHFRQLFLALCPEWKMGLDASLRAPFFLRSIETQSPFVPPACLSASNRRRLLAAAAPPSLPRSVGAQPLFHSPDADDADARGRRRASSEIRWLLRPPRLSAP